MTVRFSAKKFWGKELKTWACPRRGCYSEEDLSGVSSTQGKIRFVIMIWGLLMKTLFLTRKLGEVRLGWGGEVLIVNWLIGRGSVLEKNGSGSEKGSDKKVPVVCIEIDDQSGGESSQRFAPFETPTFMSKIEPEIENTPDTDRIDSPLGVRGDIDFGNFSMKVQSCEEFLPEATMSQNKTESRKTDSNSPRETIQNIKLGILTRTNSHSHSQCSYSEMPMGISTLNEQSNNISFLTNKERLSVKRIKVQLPGHCPVLNTESIKRSSSPYEPGHILSDSRLPDEGDTAMNLGSMA